MAGVATRSRLISCHRLVCQGAVTLAAPGRTEVCLDNATQAAAVERHHIAVGIFAYNEESTITRTLDQLRAMDWTDLDVGAIILANGCTDRTVEFARAHLASKPVTPHLDIQVVETPTRGKSATWNYYVHTASDPAAEALVFADCDLEFGAPDVIARMIGLLTSHPEAHCSVSLPTKLIDDHTSKFASVASRGPATYDNKTSIAGSLYCLRAPFARSFRLPSGLPGEDGFVRAMVVTDLFTAADNTRRIASDDAIRHFFRPVDTMRGWYRHERRLLTGSTINYFIYQVLWEEVGTSSELDNAGAVLRALESESSSWLPELVERHARTRRWLIPRDFMLRRFNDVSGRRISLSSIPKRVTMTLLDWAAAVGANRLLHRGKGVGHW